MNDHSPIEGERLRAHERRVARDLEYLGVPAANWPLPEPAADGAVPIDVLVVGAGMNGIAVASSLLFKGIRNVRILDRNPPGREGPWLSFARMDTLRSPKTLPGPALGVPSLTFRAWYEAAFGEAAWDALYKIPNAVWVRYLTWLQRVLGLPVQHGTRVVAIAPGERLHTVETERDGVPQTLLARRVILATGRGGAGGGWIPSFVDQALWPDLAAHTNDDIDFERLKGQAIGIVGGGASAWDNAATALERGAARVDMYVRRPHLPQINKGRGSSHPGYYYGWSALDDAERWALFAYLNDVQAPPPHETVHRALRQPNFHVHLGKATRRATREGDRAAVLLAGEDPPRLHDFLIVGTGFAIDGGAIPELGNASGFVARWQDRYEPPDTLARQDLGRYPYLGPGFELLEREAGECPGLNRIHLVNHAAALSHGAVASDIPGVNVAAERVSTAIAASLFKEDIEPIRQALEAFDEPELESTPFFVR
ncbi:NAD(P)-binding domain-containing protein [Microvirga pudoricolor]|uniref:NAD(P)-binding domain-containing protein n=1 Tax=Microvirga pudoricolor TaxID=2778729 RepID=UPI00195051C1|nr:NAD(P)/FAD-dependent oxidoreductase [Microvirga pudoricolor]MBM6596474.1 NAD(P)/FAD-dependent oxidoreductase [Microvirga pudoricolor]